MTSEEIESKWVNLKCPVCEGKLNRTNKKYSLLNPEIFKEVRNNSLEVQPYICDDCGCTIFRSMK